MIDLRSILIAHSAVDLAKLPEETRLWVQGSIQQRERLSAVAEWCVRNHPGDLIEIGCLHGGTTVHLADIAQSHGRHVICVDPWPPKCPLTNTDYGPDPFAIFKERLQPWWDILDVFKTSSMDAATVPAIKSRPLAFAFVDGLHSYEATLSDIKTVSHCSGVIAVDDVLWSEDVRRAYDEGAKLIKRRKVWLEHNREGYLV